MSGITSVFETLRPCLRCGAEFYPPRRPDRLILDYCSAVCETKTGLRPMKRSGFEIASAAKGKDVRVVRQPPRTYYKRARSPFATRLTMRRLAAGLTQRDLAQKIGVCRQIINTWETDISEPSVRHLAALVDVLGGSMDDLYRGTDATRQEAAS